MCLTCLNEDMQSHLTSNEIDDNKYQKEATKPNRPKINFKFKPIGEYGAYGAN